tara:strand:+ start:836 stop:1234 length:399 start_codon:yes stop_codon:yes gene_type:complete
MEIITNREMTNFNRIYKGSYWGGFKYKEENKEIIDNRNNFIVDYNIKKRVTQLPIRRSQKHLGTNNRIPNPKSVNSLFDHMEYYYTHDKQYVIIASPYNGNATMNDFFDNLEFKKIYNLYYSNASTYCLVVN